MTESEWLTCTQPREMMEHIAGRASKRQQQLFAVAGFHCLSRFLPHSQQHQAIEVLEQLADGTVAETERALACRAALRCWETGDDDYSYTALMLYRALIRSYHASHALQAVEGITDGAGDRREYCRIIRDIFGNPFHPVAFAPFWLTGNVVPLAQAIYQDRSFDRLAILADALEDAGCKDTALLEHCRQRGEHVRGCWVVDLLLGKR